MAAGAAREGIGALGAGRLSAPLRATRPTVALAALAVATAGTVIGGELVRMARRRRSAGGRPPGTLIGAAGIATLDAVNVAATGYRETPRHETVLFNILAGFTGAFASVRLATWGQRSGWWPVGPLRLGDRHIHHFVPGILIAFGAGGAGLATTDERLEEALAFVFGGGVGLTFDEAALLLDLRDVYWTREGIVSVQVSLGLAAILSTTLLALRIVRRGERRGVELGLIPGPAREQEAETAGPG